MRYGATHRGFESRPLRHAPDRPAPVPADPREAIAHVRGGRVLDIATGRGGFIEILRDGLADFDEIVGIDRSDAGAEAFAASFGGDPRIRFVEGDALRPGFPPASFDTVSISNSLHHFADAEAILGQALRLLRPGGTLVVGEMYRDGQARTQLTHVRLHHWWGAVDRAEGVVHRRTSRREDLVALVANLGLADLRLTDVRELAGDPRDPEELAELDRVVDRYLERCAGRGDLVARGEALRRRLHEIGIHAATTLVAVGRRRPPG
jgi:SAM-dependent methyltransferase